MTRLLFLGLWSFADDLGVQPLRPHTIRMQVFPGDTIDGDAVRAMIEELAARGLVHPYSVDGQDHIAIVGWDRPQRVGKHARCRFPDISGMDHGLMHSPLAAGTNADHSNPPIADHSNPPSTCAEEDGQAVISLASLQGPQIAPRMTGGPDLPYVAPGMRATMFLSGRDAARSFAALRTTA